MILPTIFITTAGWCLSVIFFEFGYLAVSNHLGPGRKGLLCKFWWVFQGLVMFALSPRGSILQLPSFFALGISHIHLAYQKEQVITLFEVFRNIPTAIHRWAEHIRPFLK